MGRASDDLDHLPGVLGDGRLQEQQGPEANTMRSAQQTPQVYRRGLVREHGVEVLAVRQVHAGALVEVRQRRAAEAQSEEVFLRAERVVPPPASRLRPVQRLLRS